MNNDIPPNIPERLEARAPQLHIRHAPRIRRGPMVLGALTLLLMCTALYAAYTKHWGNRHTRPVVIEAGRTVHVPDYDAAHSSIESTELATNTAESTPIAVEKVPAATPIITAAPVEYSPQPTVVVPPMNPMPLVQEQSVPASYYNTPSSVILPPIVRNQAPSETGFFKDEYSEVKRGAVRELRNADTLLARGTYIRCILETKIISDVAGFTSCVLPDPVYSLNGERVLLPKGSRISGEYQIGGMQGSAPRVAVMWQRIITPNHLDVRLDSPGVGVNGSAGLSGKVKSNLGKRLGATIMLSMVSDIFKYAGTQYGPSSVVTGNGVTTQNPFESNTAAGIQGVVAQSLNNSINLPPSITVKQGSVITIYTARDIDFAQVQ